MSELEREKSTRFDYLLNAFEHAAQSAEPTKNGYAEARTALFAYVSNLAVQSLAARSAPSPTRESLHAEWMAQEEYLDWSNFLLHKLTDQAPSDLRREIEVWAKALLLRAEIIEHDPYLQLTNLRVDLRELVKFLAAPGESAPATHDNLSCAVCGKGMELVSGDPRAFYKCSSCEAVSPGTCAHG